jgi:hypothetical protein
MRTFQTLNSIHLTPRCALAAAAVFHLALTLTVFGVGRLGLFPSQFDRDGIGEFAMDGRVFREQANLLGDLLREGKVLQWADGATTLDVKLYSLDLLLARPLLGPSILSVEPLNLIYYLVILMLTFGLAREVGGRAAAWAASAIVGLWPSLLLHTTQIIRDPLLISAVLALVVVLTQLLTRACGRRDALAAGLTATAACFTIWFCRREMWPVVMAMVFFASALFVIRIVRGRRLLACNLGLVGLLFALMVVIPRTAQAPRLVSAVESSITGRNRNASFWSPIADARSGFISEGLMNNSGSLVDTDVTFSGPGDVIKYVPRALEIGYLSPFPRAWFSAGYQVGLAGRLMSGLEMSLTYIIEALACVFMWQGRRRLDAWLLLLTTTTGVLALGLVVVNVGTLYRMRYSFWILLVVMAAAAFTRDDATTGPYFESREGGARAVRPSGGPES